MLDIVVYENKKNFIIKNIECINLSIYEKSVSVYKYDSYNTEFDFFIRNNKDKKIYILDDEVDGVSGLELAKEIRKYDLDSIIILIIDFDKYIENVFNIKLMALDIIFINTDYVSRLVDDIKLAISIIMKKDMFVFKYNHVLYRIPYNKICYIEKESMIKRCIIHTVDKDYYITENINSILSHLDNNFCRTHQSCIVNLNNIRMIDMKSNVIEFNNGDKTDMLNSKMKKVIKDYVGLS